MTKETFIIEIESEPLHFHDLDFIAGILKQDGLVVFPTETFYGLGANCFSPEAVRKIYALKMRDIHKPLSIVISDLDMIDVVVSEIPPVFKILTSAFWPGPLTLVLKASSRVPKELTGSSGTIGVRLPDHRMLRSLVSHAGFPLTATSANLSGEEDISDPADVIRLFSGKVDIIIDGGKTEGGKASTVLDVSSSRIQVLREGKISLSSLVKVLGETLI